jgi:membrane-associated phospholipid phosphatase
LVLPTRLSAKPERCIFWEPSGTANICGKPASSELKPSRDYSLNSAFSSGHAATSWALARVIAAEYPGWLTKVGVYGFATAISASRITARQHFPSDVVVGSTFGYLIGGYVIRHHSSANQDAPSYTLLPVFDHAQHAYGVTVVFTPHSKQMKETVHRLQRFSSLFDRK